MEAGPGAGKSALMAWLVLNPPPRTCVISFFVTARPAGASNSAAFTDGLLDQLAAVTGEQVPLRPRRRYGTAAPTAAGKAAAQAVKAGRRLVLVVDGLDADSGPCLAPGWRASPPACPSAPRTDYVLVAGRPDPGLPADVDADHPLHSCRVRRSRLAPRRPVIRAQRELDEVLAATGIATTASATRSSGW